MEESIKVCFKISGEFITHHSRNLLLEGNWESAIRFLKDSFDDQIDEKLNSKFGWLSPKGDFYPCSFRGHYDLSYRILKGILKIEPSNAERELEELGYIKFSEDIFSEKPFIYGTKKPTQAQKDITWDWCQKHKEKYPEYFEDYNNQDEQPKNIKNRLNELWENIYE